RSIGAVYAAHLDPACANDLVLRYGQPHVVDAEISEEFGRIVVLVAIPGAVPPDSDLGEPLSAEQEITFPAGSGLRLGKLRLEGDLELNECTCRDRLGQAQVDDRLIIFITVVRGNELQIIRQVPLSDNLDTLDLFRTVVFRFPLLVMNVSAAHQLG